MSYRGHGARQSSGYSDADKRRICAEYLTGYRTATSVSRHYGISRQAFYKWLRKPELVGAEVAELSASTEFAAANDQEAIPVEIIEDQPLSKPRPRSDSWISASGLSFKFPSGIEVSLEDCQDVVGLVRFIAELKL